MFKTGAGLRDLYPRLLSHSTLCFGAKEVMNFLGRKLSGNFQGEVVSDLSMGTSMYLREYHFPNVYSGVAH